MHEGMTARELAQELEHDIQQLVSDLGRYDNSEPMQAIKNYMHGMLDMIKIQGKMLMLIESLHRMP